MSNHDLKVLIVEDEIDIANHLKNIFTTINSRVELTIADSRDQAIQFLNDSEMFFDFITLDLTIPASSQGFEKSPHNGLAVLGHCKDIAQGTPILIFTGTSTVNMMQEFLKFSHNVDVWSEGVCCPTIDHLTKTEFSNFRDKANKIVVAVKQLSDIELNCSNFTLTVEHDRLIRIFTKKHNGVSSNVKAIGGGLSAAKVYSVEIFDSHGQTIHKAVAKCGPMDDIEEDSVNYDRMISRLKPDVTPRKLDHIKFGAKSSSGVFYGLATDYDYSFFTATENKLISENLKEYILKMMDCWYNSSSQVRIKIQDVRRALVKDSVADELYKTYKLDWAEMFESNKIQSNKSCYHGDLHGENILLDVKNERATLIDYGDVSEGTSLIDPVTLECSFLFHPDATKYDWPTAENISNWEDIDKFVLGCPIEEEIRFCRNWSNKIKAGNRELAACLYAYSLRQLKYPETNKDIALNLIKASQRIYENS